MKTTVLSMAVVASCWALVHTTDPITLTPTMLVVLAAGAVKFMFTMGAISRIGKRSVDGGSGLDENMLLTTVTQLDPNGCILKLVCSLQTRVEKSLTLEEAALAHMFDNTTESLTSANAAFVYAAGVGRQTRDPASCDKLFSKCPLEEGQLSRLFEQSWNCNMKDLQ